MTKKHNIDNYNIIEYEKSNVYIIENIIDDIMCNEIKNLIDRLKTKKISFFPGNNVQCFQFSTSNDDFISNDDELYYPFSTDNTIYKKLLENIKLKKIYTNKFNGVLKSEIENMDNYLNTVIKKVKSILFQINPHMHFEGVMKYIYRKIYGNTREHSDGLSSTGKPNEIYCINESKKNELFLVRSITFIFSLNDDYDGGEFNFPYYDISIKLKKGSIIIFPPYWTHRHNTNNLENNTYRYTVSTWGFESL